MLTSYQPIFVHRSRYTRQILNLSKASWIMESLKHVYLIMIIHESAHLDQKYLAQRQILETLLYYLKELRENNSFFIIKVGISIDGSVLVKFTCSFAILR